MRLWLCTASVHNTAQNSSDNLPSYLQTTIVECVKDSNCRNVHAAPSSATVENGRVREAENGKDEVSTWGRRPSVYGFTELKLLRSTDSFRRDLPQLQLQSVASPGCCEEGQSWKLGHGALTADFRAWCSSGLMTNSFVTNAVLLQMKELWVVDIYARLWQTTQYLDSWLRDLL